MQIDMRILELLASKVCHDLVSPVGAINNGVELIAEVGGGVVDEAMQLISDSATQASRRLRLFRLAYGRAGSEGNLTFKDVREILESQLEGTKVKLSWGQAFPPAGFVETRAALKSLINLVMLANECLVYGGEIVVSAAPNTLAQVEAVGRGASLSAPMSESLFGKCAVDDVSARTVHAYVTGRFLDHFGFSVTVLSAGDDRVLFSLLKA